MSTNRNTPLVLVTGTWTVAVGGYCVIPKSSDEMPKVYDVEWLKVSSSTSRLAGAAKTRIPWRNVSINREQLISLQRAIIA